MKPRAVLIGALAALFVGLSTGCSSTSRPKRHPSAAIVVSGANGYRPSAAEIAELHKTLQPEIEKRGFVMAESSRSADFFVHVRFPLDPFSLRMLWFEQAPPTVPFVQNEWNRDRTYKDYKRAIADMVTEPK